jgi:hypothetical protein
VTLRNAAQHPAESLFAGDLNDQALGVLVESGGSKIVVRSFDRRPDTPTLLFVDPATRVALSRNWRRGILSKVDDEGRLQWHWIGGDAPPPLDGNPSLEPNDDGTTLLASYRDESGTRRLEVLGRDGEEPANVPVRGLRFAALGPRGDHVLAAGTDELALHDRWGGLQETFGFADDAWLSTDGARMNYRRAGELRSFSLAHSTVNSFAIHDEGIRSWSTRATDGAEAFVQRDRVTVIDPAQSVRALIDAPAPGGFEYRSASFSSTDGRLAAGRIAIESPLRGEGAGQASLAVDVFDTASGSTPIASLPPFSVTRWNRRSPEVAFGDDGRVLVFAWPSAWAWEWRP